MARFAKPLVAAFLLALLCAGCTAIVDNKLNQKPTEGVANKCKSDQACLDNPMAQCDLGTCCGVNSCPCDYTCTNHMCAKLPDGSPPRYGGLCRGATGAYGTCQHLPGGAAACH